MKGEDMCPNPIMRFEDGNFPDYVMTEIVRAGFTAPTAIQSQGFSIRYEDFRGMKGLQILKIITMMTKPRLT